MLDEIKRAQFFVPFLVGALIGGAVFYPLGSSVPSSAGSFFGAALGATIAVLGALWVDGIKRRREALQATTIVVNAVSAPIFAFLNIQDILCNQATEDPAATDPRYKWVLGTDHWREITKHCEMFIEDKKRMALKVDRAKHLLHLLDIEAFRALDSIEYEMDTLSEVIADLFEQSVGAANRVYGGGINDKFRDLFMDHAAVVDLHYSVLIEHSGVKHTSHHEPNLEP